MIISFSYIKSYKELTLDKQQPNYEFLGHPVNAYHFVRHVASSWKIIHDNVIANGLADDMGKLKHMESQFLFSNDRIYSLFPEMLKNREKEKLPDEYDVKGGAFGLVRLQSMYTFDLNAFTKEGRISTTLDNGKVVLSEPSVLPLNCKCRIY